MPLRAKARGKASGTVRLASQNTASRVRQVMLRPQASGQVGCCASCALFTHAFPRGQSAQAPERIIPVPRPPETRRAFTLIEGYSPAVPEPRGATPAQWRRNRQMRARRGAQGLLIALTIFGPVSCGKTDGGRPVYPVRGQVFFKGKPTPGRWSCFTRSMIPIRRRLDRTAAWIRTAISHCPPIGRTTALRSASTW